MADKVEKMSIEESFQRMDELLSLMQQEGVSLEESFRYYEEGMKLVKSCNSAIDQVEKKVKKISGNGELDDFQ